MGPPLTHILSLSFFLLSFLKEYWGKGLASVECNIQQAHYQNSSYHLYELDMIAPILQMKTLTLREVKLIAHKSGHNTADKKQSWDPTPVWSKSPSFPLKLHHFNRSDQKPWSHPWPPCSLTIHILSVSKSCWFCPKYQYIQNTTSSHHSAAATLIHTIHPLSPGWLQGSLLSVPAFFPQSVCNNQTDPPIT